MTWGWGNRGKGRRKFEGINQGRLAHVRVANNTNCQWGGVGVLEDNNVFILTVCVVDDFFDGIC